MSKNNIQQRLRVANTSISSDETAIALAATILDAGYTPQHPPGLGLVTSIEIMLLYMEANLTQRLLAWMYHTWQSTVCRAINAIIDALDTVLPDPPEVTDLNPDMEVVVDGTVTPIQSRDKDLYSFKKKNFGLSMQVVTATNGAIVYLGEPVPGTVCDKTALEATGLLDVIDAKKITADRGYQGTGCRTPIKKKRRNIPLEDWEKEYNKKIGGVRYVVEQSIAHVKRWKFLATGSRLSRE